MLGLLFEACCTEHERTKVAKRPLLESDPSRSDRDRRARISYSVILYTYLLLANAYINRINRLTG